MPHPVLMEPLRRWDPEQIGGYVLVGRLGAGAMGQVYLGRSAAGRIVAVKTIKIEFAEEPDFRTRFAQEVAAARRVSGAFTAPVVAADPEADVPWLATAYVPAPSLSTLVRTCGPLSVPAVRWLAAGCAEALESIHAAGLVHRDLKPSNVLVSPDGPRVIDFGVARAAERIQLTVTRGAVGTPAYMAPEQARDTRHATMASDVYSLGATMLFAATGHGPYQGDTVMDVLVQLATEPPDLSDLPADLAGIVQACLERDPRKRPAPAFVLAHLAPGIGLEADASELGPFVLSGPALALIAEYRRDPRPAAGPGTQTDEDDTLGSQPAASGTRGGPGRRRALPPGAGRKAEREDGSRAGGSRAGGRLAAGGMPQAGGRPGSGARSRQPRRRPVLAVLGSALAAAVLIAAGTVIGAVISSSRPQSPQPSLGPLLPPPPGQAGPPGPAGKPAIGLPQLTGDSHTVFVLHGQGWPPGQQVTVTLTGTGFAPAQVTVDDAGTFNYAINQGPEFLPGGLPLGTYQVAVTAADGARAVARFSVDRR